MDSNETIIHFEITEDNNGQISTRCKLCNAFWRKSLHIKMMRVHLSDPKYEKVYNIKVCPLVSAEIQNKMIQLLEKENLSSQVEVDIFCPRESFRSSSSTTATESSYSTSTRFSVSIATETSYSSNQSNSINRKRSNISFGADLARKLQKSRKVAYDPTSKVPK